MLLPGFRAYQQVLKSSEKEYSIRRQYPTIEIFRDVE